MPHGASSMRSTSASASSACFDAAYGPRNGSALRPPTEPMRTTRPRARRSAGSNACRTATWPTTFTSSCRRSSSSGTSSSGAATAMPALSTSPWSSGPTVSAAAAICSASVTSSVSGSTPPSRSAAAACVGTDAAEHAPPRLREPERTGEADAGRRPGDDDRARHGQSARPLSRSSPSALSDFPGSMSAMPSRTRGVFVNCTSR